MSAGILAFVREASKRQDAGFGQPETDVTIELTTGTARRGLVEIDRDHPDVIKLYRRIHGSRGALHDAWQGGTALEPYVIAVRYVTLASYAEDS